MKKIYMMPETLVLNIQTSSMIAGSQFGPVEEGQNLSDAPTTDDTSGNLGRRGLWDDDDDEY